MEMIKTKHERCMEEDWMKHCLALKHMQVGWED